MCERSSILELLGAKCPGMRSLYDVGDVLYAHREQIMEQLFANTKALLGFGETIVFYDLTNTYSTGGHPGELLKFGRSKEKRSDYPLVSLAMVSGWIGLSSHGADSAREYQRAGHLETSHSPVERGETDGGYGRGDCI